MCMTGSSNLPSIDLLELGKWLLPTLVGFATPVETNLLDPRFSEKEDWGEDLGLTLEDGGE